MDGDLTKQEGLILHRMFAALFNAQMTRKTLIALRGEYVSKFQWLLGDLTKIEIPLKLILYGFKQKHMSFCTKVSKT